MKNIIKLLLLLSLCLNAGIVSIGDLNLSYKITNDIDIVHIKTATYSKQIFQRNLWNNADIALNLLSLKKKELQFKLSYLGNRELGYIYTFTKEKKSFKLTDVQLYELENGKVCNTKLKRIAKDTSKIQETNKCYKLQKYIISLKELQNLSTYHYLRNILTIDELNDIMKLNKLTQKTLTTYNNIAYYLQKAGANKEAAYLLEKIIEKFPDRTVAYYNLGDAYWALGEKQKAIKAYTTYIEQMCHKGLQKKIPKMVLERVSKKK